MWRILLSFILAFIITAVLMPLVIKLCKKLKARQTILHYVDNHASKSGTPTMGGIGFIIAIAAATLLATIGTDSWLALVAVLVTVGYGVVGFLDDFIKIFYKQNKGLAAWQKIIFQLAIALVVAIFAYFSDIVGASIFLPFSFRSVYFGIFIIPFAIIIFLAFSNAVNLTDGLDGLAGKVTLVYMLFNGAILFTFTHLRGYSLININEYTSLIAFAGAVVGGILGFLLFNSYPAKIFMGDTGALALGGSVGAFAVISGLSLYSPIVGIMYVLTCLSVMIQVSYFKITKGKRVFLMSPLHHHFERKGMHENQIVTMYTAITAVMGSLALMVTLLVAG